MRPSRPLILAALMASLAPLSVQAAHHCEGGQCWMNKFDTDKDGQVSDAEFRSFHDARFDKADADKNGQLSRDEFQAMAKKRMEKMRAAHAKHHGNGKHHSNGKHQGHDNTNGQPEGQPQ